MADLRLLPPSADAASRAADGVIQLSGHRALPAFDAPPAAVLRMPPAPILAPALPERLLPVGGVPATWETASWDQQDVPVPVFDTAMDIAALVALSNCQHALLQVQELAIRHLMATGSDEAEPVTFAATAIPEAEPEVRIVEAVAIDEASPALETPGVTFTREQLEVHASGRISEIFGPAFAAQDAYAAPGSHADAAAAAGRSRGRPARRTRESCAPARSGPRPTCAPTRWYLHEGRMPAGILIESGQADLMLISWLGVDLQNRGERVYRLLGCELTFHGQLPRDRRDAALRNPHRRARAARRRAAVLLPLRLPVRRRPAPQRAPGPGRLLHRRRARRERRHPVEPRRRRARSRGAARRASPRRDAGAELRRTPGARRLPRAT